MPADVPSSLQALPVSLQGLVEAGAFIGTLIVAVVGYAKPKKAATTAVEPNTDARTIALAIANPLADANQLRQLIEGVNRLGDFAEHGLATLDDIKSAQDRTAAAFARVEESNNRTERAVRALDDTMSRSQRR